MTPQGATFVVPQGLAPEVHPLAWLLGTWRGTGFLAYPDISERPFVQEVVFGHDGGPYLTYGSTIWLLDETVEAPEAGGAPDGQADEPRSTEVRYTRGPVWAAETGYWRPAVPAGARAAGGSGQAPGSNGTASGGSGQAPGSNGTTSGDSGQAPGGAAEPSTDLEVMVAEPSGHVSIYLGQVRGPRVEIATDLLARTATAAEINAVHRMYGLVGGELMWALDMAAFGHELRPYASARLTRVTEGE